MALAIATNTAALNAAASASSVNRDMETSMARLSTGKRINSASDDAAGVAISSRLSAEIRGTDQAIRNSLDGQALLDTAEGAHKEIENILQRMREVSVQSANDTNNGQDRANLQAEMDAMVTEIDRIASTTTWAGANLMEDSSGTNFSFQVGAATGSQNQIEVSIGSMGARNLGLSGSNGAQINQANVDQAAFDALVATKNSTAGTAATAATTYASAQNGLAAVTAIETANKALHDDSATPEKQAAAIRDILVGIDAGAAAGVTAMAGTDALGMDQLVVEFQASITDHITDQSEQNDAQVLHDTFEAAVVTFKASTTNDTALSTFNAVATAYDALIGAKTTQTSADLTATTGATLGALNTSTARGAAGTATGLKNLAAQVTDHKTETKVLATADVATAKTTATTAAAAMVVADSAALAAQQAVTASNDPATLNPGNLSVGSGDSARASITTIDAAIQTVNIQRSELGAVSNRLNHTVNNLTNISSNLSAAKGGIEDADFALETTNLAKNQILQQASTAMLAQANASKQNVLSLLQG